MCEGSPGRRSHFLAVTKWALNPLVTPDRLRGGTVLGFMPVYDTVPPSEWAMARGSLWTSPSSATSCGMSVEDQKKPQWLCLVLACLI